MKYISGKLIGTQLQLSVSAVIFVYWYGRAFSVLCALVQVNFPKIECKTIYRIPENVNDSKSDEIYR